MQKPIKIAIIGAGQLGSRHLQALARLDRPAAIQVVDPSAASLATAKERFGQVYSQAGNITRVEYLSNIHELNDTLDFVVIATNANVRRAIIEQLVNTKTVRYLILEKVVFQCVDDFSAVDSLLAGKKISAWVNCARRMWPFYQELRNKLAAAEFVDYRASGSQWGLGCNSIHLLDIFAFISGRSQFVLSGDFDEAIIPSKRPGFVEFTGTIRGSAGSRGTISLTSYDSGNVPMLIDITADSFRCLIRESEGKAWISDQNTNWHWQEAGFQVLYQSQLTSLAVQQILDTEQCHLPTYRESWKLHIPLLNLFNEQIKNSTMEDSKICPIT